MLQGLRPRLALGVLALVAAVAVSRAQKPQPAEQTYFEEGGKLQNPEPLSPEALQALLAHQPSSALDEDAEDRLEKDPDKFFHAAAVHLNSPEQVDAVALGVCPLCGADNGWFWVIRSARKDPKVVLFANGNSIELLDTQTNGYRDIRSSWSSPNETQTDTYHYDGRRYKLWKHKTAPNR
jgi:hypothetical protein